MKNLYRTKHLFCIILTIGLLSTNAQTAKKPPQSKSEQNTSKLMIRMAELEIEPQYLTDYLAILQENAAKSVELEPGVIAIFPMQQAKNPNQIRIVEIYASTTAYQSHLQTAHFQYYKTATLKMVKSLALVEMQSIDPKSMDKILRKIKQ